MARKKNPTQLRLSQAIDGFFLELHARRLSPHTISDYQNTCNKLTAWLRDDPYMHEIEATTIQKFLAYLGNTPQQPNTTIRRQAKPLSKKSVLNIHTGLSALWTWALREGIISAHIIRDIPRPRPEKRVIIPFTRDEVAAMLNACSATKGYFQKRTWCANSRPTELRDQAIIRTLTDTGLRASELCDLKIGDFDMPNHRLKVFGKGSKERVLALGDRTTKAIWLYLTKSRPANINADEPLFATDDGVEHLTRRALGLLLERIGERAGVPDVHPHRFRHTFAITYLRNDGDVYSLQMMLGHSTLDMVRRYLAIAQTDVEKAHRRASPIDNWKL